MFKPIGKIFFSHQNGRKRITGTKKNVMLTKTSFRMQLPAVHSWSSKILFCNVDLLFAEWNLNMGKRMGKHNLSIKYFSTSFTLLQKGKTVKYATFALQATWG